MESLMLTAWIRSSSLDIKEAMTSGKYGPGCKVLQVEKVIIIKWCYVPRP